MITYYKEMHKQLKKIVENSHFHLEYQSGFNNNHSMCYQIIGIVEDVIHKLNINTATVPLFLDVLKAFDRDMTS